MLLVEGAKTIEVRSWRTHYRGSLLICASAAPRNAFWIDREDEDKKPYLLHAGCMLGVVELIDCRPMIEEDDDPSFGAFEDGAFAWVTKSVSYCRPDAIKGRLNLFDVPDEKVIPLADNDGPFNYPTPQGDVKYTAACPVIE